MSEAKPAKKADQQTSIAERRHKARAFRRRESFGLVQNADPKLHYSVFFTSDFHETVCNQMRDALERRGFEPVNGPRYEGEPQSEFVADRPSAEIWACPIEIRDDEWRDSLLDCLRNQHWVLDEERKPELRTLSPKVLAMAREYHKVLRRDGAAAAGVWTQLEQIVLKTPIIKLGSKQE